jgi:dienelactone hydrolase
VILRRFLVVVVLLLGTGCAAGGGAEDARIEVDRAEALVDEQVDVRVTGLDGGRQVEVQLTGADVDGVTWRSSGTWVADARGVVDLGEDAPLEGSYDGVDGMGLFWSMTPTNGSPGDGGLEPPGPGAPFTLRLAVRSEGRELATREVVRRWLGDGVTARALTIATDGVAGVLYTPPPGGPARPPVLALGGSDGRAQLPTAAQLASHGFPTLALDYFGDDGLPETLRDVPLEYFATAAELLRRETGGDRRVALVGYSRGTEAAMLLADDRPDLVERTVLYAPNNLVWGAYPGPGDAWTRAGTPVRRGPLPVDGVTGPVLALAGGRDATWNASGQAAGLAAAFTAAGVAHQVLQYPDAGHGVGTHPYLAAGDDGTGTRAADAAARADGWPRVLEFLAPTPTPAPPTRSPASTTPPR